MSQNVSKFFEPYFFYFSFELNWYSTATKKCHFQSFHLLQSKDAQLLHLIYEVVM